jgi:hypothetical protein
VYPLGWQLAGTLYAPTEAEAICRAQGQLRERVQVVPCPAEDRSFEPYRPPAGEADPFAFTPYLLHEHFRVEVRQADWLIYCRQCRGAGWIIPRPREGEETTIDDLLKPLLHLIRHKPELRGWGGI